VGNYNPAPGGGIKLPPDFSFMSQVFAFYIEAQLDLIRPWARSWESHGFIPRLLTHRDSNSEKAIREKGGGFLYSLSVINFGWKRGTKPPSKVFQYGSRGWETAQLVEFETEEQVLSCGRTI
jgi:hypothetical protein